MELLVDNICLSPCLLLYNSDKWEQSYSDCVRVNLSVCHILRFLYWTEYSYSFNATLHRIYAPTGSTCTSKQESLTGTITFTPRRAALRFATTRLIVYKQWGHGQFSSTLVSACHLLKSAHQYQADSPIGSAGHWHSTISLPGSLIFSNEVQGHRSLEVIILGFSVPAGTNDTGIDLCFVRDIDHIHTPYKEIEKPVPYLMNNPRISIPANIF